MKLTVLKEYQRPLILLIGYVLVLGIGFGLGKIASSNLQPPEIRIEEVFSPSNDSENLPDLQSTNLDPTASKQATGFFTTTGECDGKIKGNIGSSNDRVYHTPSGSFYKRVAAEVCFNNEQEAVAAGFRKSSR